MYSLFLNVYESVPCSCSWMFYALRADAGLYNMEFDIIEFPGL
jgi:hypothetical protein